MNAQQLKNSILQMAVSGKLVPQDPNDEPASVLLERIRKEKEQLIKEGKIKKEKNPSYIFRGADNTPYEKVGKNEPVSIAEEVPFEIPESWEWCRLGDIFYHNTGKALNASNQSGQLLKYITTSNLYWNRFELDSLRQMYFTDAEIEKCTATKGDLLVCEGGDIGRAAIWPLEYDIRIQNHIHRLRAYVPVCTEYYYYIFYLYKHVGWIGGKGIGIQGLSANALHSLLFPLPPIKEQQRIVEKISQIEPYAENESTESKLAALNSGFPEQLRKSILQLAIQGKLVPQDPNDEPASVLLERIRTEKERLIKDGKIKRDKNESVIYRRDNSHYEKRGKTEVCIDEEILFDTPKSWQWVRLSSVCSLITDGEHKTPQRVSSFQGYYLLSARNIRDGSLALDDVDYVDATEYENISKRCNPQRNDILISCSGSVGRVCRVEDNNNYVMVRSAAMVSPILVNSEFLMYSLQSGIVQTQIKEKTKQTAQANLFQGAIRELLLPVPPVNEQNRICEAIVPLLKLCKFSL